MINMCDLKNNAGFKKNSYTMINVVLKHLGSLKHAEQHIGTRNIKTLKWERDGWLKTKNTKQYVLFLLHQKEKRKKTWQNVLIWQSWVVSLRGFVIMFLVFFYVINIFSNQHNTNGMYSVPGHIISGSKSDCFLLFPWLEAGVWSTQGLPSYP